jgi:hypothetical protein
MRIVHVLGKQKLVGKAKILDLVKNSSLTVDVNADKILIKIYGQAANIPSLKNSKLQGKNFTNPNYLKRIKALDVLFHLGAIHKDIPRFLDNEQICVIVINAKRNTNFDPIGCLETVQDWLEPNSKKVGRKKLNRGWGIGLIADDKQAIGLSLRSDLNYSIISVQPYKYIESLINTFISEQGIK